MANLLYLAYGSNLHPLRLRERVPSAQFRDCVKLRGYRLEFHKRSVDGSAKCDLVQTEDTADRVWTAVYGMSREHKTPLDRAEGAGHGYREIALSVELSTGTVECFTYVAEPSHIEPDLRPYHWYKSLVVLGARHFGMPESYVKSIEAVESMDDPDPIERSRNEHLVARLRQTRAAVSAAGPCP